MGPVIFLLCCRVNRLEDAVLRAVHHKQVSAGYNVFVTNSTSVKSCVLFRSVSIVKVTGLYQKHKLTLPALVSSNAVVDVKAFTVKPLHHWVNFIEEFIDLHCSNALLKCGNCHLFKLFYLLFGC